MLDYKAKWPDEKGYIHWSDEENATWQQLFRRQKNTIKHRACSEFITGLQELGLDEQHIPQLNQVNQALQKTAWRMQPVAGTIDVHDFFSMLSAREFPVANFIRRQEDLDYLKQPDIFHELFGHGPLLMHPVYADFLQWYGKTALKLSPKARRVFSRLFWYTIEFGLMETASGLRVYGGGILSSHAETIYAVESEKPQRTAFHLQTILDTDYNYQEIQKQYFVIDGWDELYRLRDDPCLLELFERDDKDTTEPFINC